MTCGPRIETDSRGDAKGKRGDLRLKGMWRRLFSRLWIANRQSGNRQSHHFGWLMSGVSISMLAPVPPMSWSSPLNPSISVPANGSA